MSKTATIASLVRTAAKEEGEFVQVIASVFEDDDVERIWEFFDRLNIPRSHGSGADHFVPLPSLDKVCYKIWGLHEERRINSGVQRFLDRHERKIKWHAGHPSIEGIDNVLLLLRASMITTNMRLKRLRLLLDGQDELTPVEWSYARELMNGSYLSFRNFLNLSASNWIDAMQAVTPREELAERLGTFYEFIDTHVRLLEEHRQHIEERRLQLTVLPEGYPPVKPPRYFHGDLMGKGPWKQYWSMVNTRAHHFRESLG